MEAIFEVKYIAIKWYDNKVIKVEEAISSIPIEVENSTTYNIEIQVYPKIKNNSNGQVAFHLLNDSSIEHYFLDASNNKVFMRKIVDPKTDKIWWIEDGELNGKYRNASLWNHIGETKIVFGNIECRVDIKSNSFTKEQLNDYLNDFKSDFWYLIFKPSSLTKGQAKATEIKLLDNDAITTVRKFIEFTEKILENPKKELREVQNLKDVKKVKPVARTFMEIATRGLSRKLTSRDTIDSYNVPENRYIHYVTQRVYNMIINIEKASTHMGKFYKKGHEYHKKRLSTFSNIMTTDKELYENDIKNLKQKIEREQEELKNNIRKQDSKIQIECKNLLDIQQHINKEIDSQSYRNAPNEAPQEYIIKLENRQNNYGNKIQFWGKIKSINAKGWDDFGENNWFSLEFLNIFHTFTLHQEYHIIGYTNYSKIETQKGIIHKIFFTHITSLELLENNLKYETIIVKITKSSTYSNLQCNGNIRLENKQWSKLNNDDFYSFEFDKNIFENIIKPYQVYKISAYIQSVKQPWQKGIIHKKYFKYITDIELLQSTYQEELVKLEQQRPILENSNWQRELTSKEKAEQEKEKQSLEQSTKQLENYKKETNKLLEELNPIVNRLKTLLKKYKSLKIKQNSYFPNSMTFIQNPNYQGANNFYKKIQNMTGIDETLFIQMQILENIGLVEVYTIYERWCLLQIIKVLIDKFHFIPEENWKLKLSKQMIDDISNIRDVNIKFINKNIEREITLLYEHELRDSKRRPDFIIDIKSTKTNKEHRLIMDAKFHEQVELKEQIEKLYYNKNYSENNQNTMFILHPDLHPIKYPRTPTTWGRDSFYGETNLFNYEWDKDKYPNHKYGAILLSPFNDSGSYLDNLQRIIGMVMQYNMEENRNINYNPIPEEKVFCLVCGSNNCNISEPIPASKYYDRWQYEVKCQEKNCGYSYIYNYCWNCKHRLIKNSRYWSYHSLQILNEFDVKCPNCNKLLSELPKERY